MKTKSIILLVIAGLFVLAGCSKLEEVKMSSTFTLPKLTAPTSGTNFKITATNVNDTMTRFTWNPANYGFEAAVTYTLQITATSSFTNATVMGTTTGTRLALLNSAMNTTLLIMGGDSSAYSAIKYRIAAVINSHVGTLYSDTGTINIKPFLQYIKYPKLYVPGDYQSWNAADSTTVIWSPTNNGMYEGYLYLSGATSGMKFLKIPAWDVDNTIGDPNSSGTSGTLQIGNWGGNNINVSGGPGVFKVNADLPDKTYAWTKTVWTLIGDATAGGWSTDTPMTYSTVTRLWTATTNLTVGGMKFRANAGWAINLGDNNGDKKLEYGGNNISIATAGNYTITLDLTQAIYKYKLVKN
jgi:starch-binding outer membrane protein SusE/F